jgi:hypothetical protein
VTTIRPENLGSAAFRQAHAFPRLDRARTLGEQLRAENGVNRAVDIVEERLRAKGLAP